MSPLPYHDARHDPVIPMIPAVIAAIPCLTLPRSEYVKTTSRLRFLGNRHLVSTSEISRSQRDGRRVRRLHAALTFMC